ncbi:G protein-coupled receptor [Trichostrongylus colubriformis]|uniref:G protein-coupled receptor n=1 Tax=Trichostrongylus colubriformis TaxID=6319 RepID=A0AAN8FPE6_TRICO
MMSEVSSHCLTERQMQLAVNDIERLFIGKIVPVLIVFGISGNILNLTVLLTPAMRTRSNILLSCLAVADTVFLVFFFPHSLAHYKIFAFSYWFRRIYLAYKMHLLAMLNWASAAAIWLILVICFERLMGIMNPLSARRHKRNSSTAVIVTVIVVTTGFLTSYYHFSHYCAYKRFCNGTQFHAMCIRSDSEKWFRNQTNPNSAFVKAVAHWGAHVNAVCVIVVPIILVLISNAMLIYTIRQRRKHFNPQMSYKSESQMSGSQSRTEQKVTTTVCAIVTCFTITQGPSAFITIMAEYYPIRHEFMIAVSAVITTMVVLGKALNFALFCLSSATFRTRLLQQTKRGLLKSARNRTQTIAVRLPQTDRKCDTTILLQATP